MTGWIQRYACPGRTWATGIVILLGMGSPAALAGAGFTLKANEDNTKDMSVNLAIDAVRNGGVQFGGSTIPPPTIIIGLEAGAALLNHDSGVLDVHHTLASATPVSSRSLIQFTTLQKSLLEHCWANAQAGELSATLRLYAIPPLGPGKHNRLLGITPSVYFPRSVDINPPPAAVPIAVYRQVTPWIEGAGQNSFFTATTDDQYLLDVQRIGIQSAGTTWEGVALQGVDTCLNRQPGLAVTNTVDGVVHPLCYDARPDWEPWVEWDVTAAVRYWMDNNFDPAVTHGFSLYQRPGATRNDQVRINPEAAAQGRTRAIVSFASSGAAADCAGAGGIWGGYGEVDIIYLNARCMSPLANDFEPGDPFFAPRFITPVTRPEWRPELRIESSNPDSSCVVGTPEVPANLDAPVGGTTSAPLVLANQLATSPIVIESFSFTGPNAAAFTISDAACRAQALDPGASCQESLTFQPAEPGPHSATLTVGFRIEGQAEVLTQAIALTATASGDTDGIPDSIEGLAPNDGDGNADGIADSEQSNVASLRDTAGQIVTIAARAGALLANVRQVELTPDDSLRGLQFELGFYAFSVSGVEVGGSIDVAVQFHARDAASFKATRYYKYGPTAGDSSDHWYEFGADGASGASFAGNTVTLRLVDGGRGDADLAANGVIDDPGGPAVDTRVDPDSVTPTDARVGAIDPMSLIVLGIMALLAAWRRARQRPGLGLCRAGRRLDTRPIKALRKGGVGGTARFTTRFASNIHPI